MARTLIKSATIITVDPKLGDLHRGDILIEGIRLPELHPGDVLAVPATGAYSASMASTYNMLPRPAAALVGGGQVRLIVRRETVDELLAREIAG